MRVYLKEPKLDEYWYEQKILADPLSMEYNAGWDVSYDGYNYETGTIDFPKERWKKDYTRRKDNNRYFAYIVRKEDNEFLGYVNFHYNKSDNRYDCGIVIEHSHRNKGYGVEALKLLCDIAFNEYKVDALHDNFEEGRSSLSIFKKVGFKPIRTFKGKRFNQDINIIEICLSKEEYLK